MKNLYSFVALLLCVSFFSQTLTEKQMMNARATGYAIISAKNPGTSFSVIMKPWDGVSSLEQIANTINSGWHAQAAIKGNFFNQAFDGTDFSGYSSVVTSQEEFDQYKSTGTQWWIVCSTLPPFSKDYSKTTAWSKEGNTGTNSTTNFIGTTDAQDLVLKTNNTQRIRVLSSGSVGVNKIPHSALSLDIDGSTRITSNATNKDAFAILNDLENNDAGIDLLFLRYGKYQPNNPSVITVSGMTTPTKYEAFFNLRANGKLGLGTYNFQNCSDCSDYRLFVKDGIKTEKVKVDVASANGWADYVFNESYNLKSLEEVEKHINENGHLPNIPSAKEVVENGINVAEMDAKLLEKIEELTLYSIEQNKKNKEQEQQLKLQSEKIEKLEKMLLEITSKK